MKQKSKFMQTQNFQKQPIIILDKKLHKTEEVQSDEASVIAEEHSDQ